MRKHTLLGGLFCVALTVLHTSCDELPQQQNGEPLKDISVNPEFEMTPPIAKRMEMEVLEKPTEKGENVRITAMFSGKQLEDQRGLALMIADEKMVLRDDGKEGDVKAGDGVFSILVKEDMDALRREMNMKVEKLQQFGEAPVFFDNRRMFKVPKSSLEAIKADFKAGVKFPLPTDLLRSFTGTIESENSLMITNIDVVEDTSRTFNPCTGVGDNKGVWTFGELMRQMASPDPSNIANDQEASDFAMEWLKTWTVDQTVNGELLPARTNVQNRIIDPWLVKSAAAGAPAGQLKMEFAPFKLIAIVNRMDLRGNSGYGFSNAGEGRFVFNAMDDNCNPLQFTVIFEYGINKKSCVEVKAFAEEWAELSNMTIGSEAYNNALQAITDQFALCGTDPSKPNQNSINQIRTNEIEIGSPWQLREFNLNTSGVLELVTVKQEPAVKYNAKVNNADVKLLAKWVNANGADIKDVTYTVPDSVNSGSGTKVPFLGGKSHTQTPSTHWDAVPIAGAGSSDPVIADDTVRHVFSLNTCAGCHGGETDTRFTHVKPAPFGSPANLSGFLTGIDVDDAANRPSAASPENRHFADLDRRKQDLEELVNMACLSKGRVFALVHVLNFDPIRMPH